MKNILDKTLDFTSGEKFYRFGNSDGKYWIMPARDMRTAMNLYQPSGIKGKMVKALLPMLHGISPVRKAIHATTLHCSLGKELHALLYNMFGTEVEFSVFEGTPSVHRKITMQLSSGRHILGYCKLSTSSDIKALFDKENKMLAWLGSKGMKGIPQVLHCGILDSGVHIFVQSTVKTRSSAVIHEWGALQERFLAKLHEKTKQAVCFEESDYCRTLDLLEKHLDWLPDNVEPAVIARIAANIKEIFSGREVEFSAYHGDFTPWNMFVEKNMLFVFDFEYAAKSYPPGLDRYHFFTQTAVFEKGWGAKEITAFMNSMEGAWIKKQEYTLYLLDIISRFTVREGKKVEGGEKELFAIWNNLIKAIE